MRVLACPVPGCGAGPFASRAGLDLHTYNQHSRPSESYWAVQKRAWRARKRGDPDAPPKKKTGPPKGSIRVMNCPTCALQYPTGQRRPKPALPFGDTEFIRRRLQWVGRKLCDELGASEEAVIVTMQVVLADDITRPRVLAAQADAKGGGSIHVYLRPDVPNGK